MQCLVQPGDGIDPLVKAVNRAKKSVEILIFRFNRSELERALTNAVKRGVQVHALIAHTNRGGEQKLRELELRLLAAGVTVTRTADDLVRYHGKLLIVDGRVLLLLAFNFTFVDIEHSRSFGIITTNPQHVREAMKLMEADTKRTPYTPGSPTFLVSPVNARERLASFIKGAKKELLIYDPEVSDPDMIRLLQERVDAGVRVDIIGGLAGPGKLIEVRKLSQFRLHTRTILRDRREAFVGSQSLRKLELDARREVGIIVRDPKVVGRLVATFESDWDTADRGRTQVEVNSDDDPEKAIPAGKVAKKVAKAVVQELGPIAPVVEMTVKELVPDGTPVKLDPPEIEDTVKGAVKDAVRQVIREYMEEAAEAQSAHLQV